LIWGWNVTQTGFMILIRWYSSRLIWEKACLSPEVEGPLAEFCLGPQGSQDRHWPHRNMFSTISLKSWSEWNLHHISVSSPLCLLHDPYTEGHTGYWVSNPVHSCAELSCFMKENTSSNKLTFQQASFNPLHWKSLPEVVWILLPIVGFMWFSNVTDWIKKRNSIYTT